MKNNHWTDNHIQYNDQTNDFTAFDEAGFVYGTYKTRQDAIDALEIYAEVAEKT